jgi:chromosome segregation ATPase
MESLLLISAMSVTTATIMIVALLLVAGLIGYLTAWFYARSVYTPVIKKLEDEKVQLNLEISGLREEITILKTRVSDLGKKVEELEMEVSEREKEISGKVDIIAGMEKELKELRVIR